MKTTVLIPAYNEEKTIAKVVSDFRKELPNSRVIVYNNNSDDNTEEYAKAAGAEVRFCKKKGKGNVVQKMFDEIDSDIYIMADADDTYPTEEVEKLIKPVVEGEADMVVGSRMEKAQKGALTGLHKFGNKVIRKAVNFCFRSNIRDMLSGYRVMNRDLVKELVLVWSFLLLHEKVRKTKVFFFITLVVGAFLVTAGGTGEVFSTLLAGDILIAISMLLYAHNYLVSSRLMEKSNPFKLYLGFSLFSLPVFIILSLVMLPLSSFFISTDNLILMLFYVLFWNVIGFPLWLISLKHMRPWALSAAIMIQTVAGAIFSFIWLGQTLSLIQIVGGIVILISVYFISLKG